MIHYRERFKFCKLLMVLLPVMIFFFHDTANASENKYKNFKKIGSTITDTVINDYKSFYSAKRWIRIGICFGIGAVAANTNIDSNVQSWYQNDVRSSGTDDFSKNVKWMGEGTYLIPLSLLTASVKFFDNESPVGNWGEHVARAYLTGSPAVLFMQAATGASRPGETNHDSRWRPFNDTNGVSGHAFIGAVPFLTIGKMCSNKYLKYIAYVASAATAFSRINDNDHYLSQIGLGWYMAWESVNAVFDADEQQQNISVVPMLGQNRYGVLVNFKW